MAVGFILTVCVHYYLISLQRMCGMKLRHSPIYKLPSHIQINFLFMAIKTVLAKTIWHLWEQAPYTKMAVKCSQGFQFGPVWVTLTTVKPHNCRISTHINIYICFHFHAFWVYFELKIKKSFPSLIWNVIFTITAS